MSKKFNRTNTIRILNIFEIIPRIIIGPKIIDAKKFEITKLIENVLKLYIIIGNINKLADKVTLNILSLIL